MKISNEAKIGAFTILGLGLIVSGFYFLKGKNIFAPRKKLYALFNSVGPLDKASLVKINGVTIGNIYEIVPYDRKVEQIKVTISLTEDVDIPLDSYGYIEEAFGGLTPSAFVIKKGVSTQLLQSNSQIAVKASTSMLGNLSQQAPVTLAKMNTTLDSLLSVFGSINNLIDTKTKNNLNETISSIRQASFSLQGTIKNLEQPVKNSLSNINQLTDNLKANNTQINEIVTNAKSFTNKLSAIDLNRLSGSIESTLTELKNTSGKLSNPNNSLGALMNDKVLYNQINKTVLGLEILLDDVRKNPKRYVNVSVFGKKDKSGPIMSPLQKDTVTQKN